jgi:RNA polymerase sigma factor (sigma-70 family)
MKDFKKQLTEKLPELKSHAMIESSKYFKNSEKDEDDLLQMTVLKALKNQHKCDGKYFLAWLKTMMTHLAIDEFRKNSIKVELKGKDLKDALAKGKKTYKMEKRAENYERETRGDDDDKDKTQSLDDIELDSPSAKEFSSSLNPKKESEILEEDENKIKLHSCISKLGKNCQEIFRLYMMVEGSFLELSKRINIPLNTVLSRFYRCKEKLLKIILKESPGEANEI